VELAEHFAVNIRPKLCSELRDHPGKDLWMLKAALDRKEALVQEEVV
jgi:hypothetical protein